MGGRKRGGFFFRWIKSDLPDQEESPPPVLLLAVHKPSNQDCAGSECHTLPYAKHLACIDPHGEESKDLISQLNRRFRKTLSLDSRTHRNVSGHTQDAPRPKSMVNAVNYSTNSCSNPPKASKTGKHKRFRPKSFFSFETFLDSKRSDVDLSSKYCKFYLDSSAECSPVLKERNAPDLLDATVNRDVSQSLSEEIRCKKRLDKLENHFNKIQKLKNSRQSTSEPFSNRCNQNEEPFYVEPVCESLTASQSTLVIDAKTDDTSDRLFVGASNCSSNTGVVSTNCQSSGRHEVLQHSESNDRPLNSNGLNHDPRDASESSIPLCGGFDIKECSSTLRNACYPSCSTSLGKVRSSRICCKERTPSSVYEINVTQDDVLINDKTKDLVVKTMDKSVDSIGSCSLDVDADNTDFSDTTSGSLNLLTPSSTASHYKDFTTKLHERAIPGICPNIREHPLIEEKVTCNQTNQEQSQSRSRNHLHHSNTASQPKKPSYLHLACSINGYSNLTTYDSTLRQKLNKSREQSPARLGNIASYMLQNYPDEMAQKLNNASGAATNPNTAYFKTSFSETSISTQNVITYLNSNGNSATTETHTSKSYNAISNGNNDDSPSKSFIQQRVERLYGPGALAQGFLNQKKYSVRENDHKTMNSEKKSSILTQNVMMKKTMNGAESENFFSKTENLNSSDADDDSVLPVLRHLRAEFRAQLPLMSPKRSPLSKLSDNVSNISPNDLRHPVLSRLGGDDVVDRVGYAHSNGKLHQETDSVVTIIPITKSESNVSANGDISKTGHSNDENFNSVNNKKDYSCSTDLGKIIDEIHDVSYDDIPVIKLNEDVSSAVQKSQNNVRHDSVVEGTESAAEDGNYFLDLCRSEMDRLEQLAKLAEKDLDGIKDNPEVSEEVRGFLRVAAGKARLLASEKMKQFEGLCFKNLNSQLDSQFPTTIGDLRGFWDMVCLQVDDIRVLFEQIDAMKRSNWKEIPSVKRSTEMSNKPSSSRSSASASKKSKTQSDAVASSKVSAAAKKRDEQRKALLEAKRRAAKTQSNNSVEIFANPPPSEMKKSS